MSFNEGHAISRNRYWGQHLGWTPHQASICTQILGAPDASASPARFARNVYDWQGEQVRMLPDGVIGPRSWQRMQRLLRNVTMTSAGSLPGARSCNNAFLFAPAENQKGYRADATGAFHPAARAFQGIHSTSAPFFFNNAQSVGRRRREIFDALDAAPGGLDTVAYFGHGLSAQMSSAGIRAADIPSFASLIRRKAGGSCKVLLYACSCGATGGFAERLATELSGNQSSLHNRFEVYAHTVPGHASRNPTKIVYPDGRFIVQPYTRLFSRWRHALTTNGLWARYPFMDEAAIQAELV